MQEDVGHTVITNLWTLYIWDSIWNIASKLESTRVLAAKIDSPLVHRRSYFMMVAGVFGMDNSQKVECLLNQASEIDQKKNKIQLLQLYALNSCQYFKNKK